MSKKSESTELATNEATSKSLAAPINQPAGFDGITADDVLTPKVKLWHPLSKSDVEAKFGDYYNVNENTNIGPTFDFLLLAQKTVRYTNEDEKTGEPVTKTYKHLLILPLATLDTPAELVLSAVNIMAVKKLTSALLAKSKNNGGSPAFAFTVKATSEVVAADLGKYAKAQFEVTGNASAEQLAIAQEAYEAFGKTYGKVAAPATDTEVQAEAFDRVFGE